MVSAGDWLRRVVYRCLRVSGMVHGIRAETRFCALRARGSVSAVTPGLTSGAELFRSFGAVFAEHRFLIQGSGSRTPADRVPSDRQHQQVQHSVSEIPSPPDSDLARAQFPGLTG